MTVNIGKADKFWVVTIPNSESELGDILFETDIKGLGNQFRGGLNSDYIVGIFGKANAKRIATDLMNKIKQ